MMPYQYLMILAAVTADQLLWSPILMTSYVGMWNILLLWQPIRISVDKIIKCVLGEANLKEKGCDND